MTIIVAYRGGYVPDSRDDAAERIEFAGAIFAHEDRTIAAMYGHVVALTLDITHYFDARSPAARAELRGDMLRAKDLGYAGVIYADDHDWSDDGVVTDGAEIAIFDPASIIFGA